MEMVWKIDDPTAAISIHGIAGAWSLLAAGIFPKAESIHAKARFVGVQLLGIVSIALFAAAATAAMFLILKRFARLRCSESDEFDGLDLAEHDIGSYPDFQQTMIKSYHLRET